jgi:spermidine/putrescine transport system permease protein
MATEVERSWRDPALIGKALPTVLLQTSCFLAPLLMTFLLTFQKTRNFQLTWAWNLDVWTDVFTKPHYWTILIHTLVMAVTCTALCVVLSLPIAYALATRMKRFENHIKILITFAFLTDATLKTFGWVLFLDAHGAANYLLEQIGFAPGTIAILFTDWATMLGMVYSLLAYTNFTIYLSIDQIDPSQILAA